MTCKYSRYKPEIRLIGNLVSVVNPKNITRLAKNVAQMADYAERVALELSLRYQNQINCLTIETRSPEEEEELIFKSNADLLQRDTTGGVETLAECAVARILQNPPEPDKDRDMVEQLVEAVFFSEHKETHLETKK